MNSEELISILKKNNAILEGHFLLTSGKHSNYYVEKFRILEDPIILNNVCNSMAKPFIDENVDVVLGAAIGGILLSGGVGRYINKKHIFCERVNNGKMELRRGFNIIEGDKVLIVEDIITTGGSVFELIKVAEDNGAKIIGIVSLIHRSEEEIDFGYKYKTLLEFPVKSWNENEVPKWLADIPITKPGRTGKK